ncbi:HNH endonuclease signature motif containing protein [Alcaligenes nematophilus]|uniref:HNH endonuclease signature motif containing protein n=1 Tax=Alcaligenes nematophilus TaxID=2994643 RepID=UPI0038504CE5
MAGLTTLAKSTDSLRLKHLLGRCVKTATGCLEYQGCVQANGYARATIRRKADHAHRHAYRLANRMDIPKGMDVCHSCDNRRCINPDHLFLGTRKENMQDAVSKGRQAKGFALPQTKISAYVEAEIVAMAKQGIPYKDIASAFGICRQHAGHIAIQNGVRRDGVSK